MEQEPKFGQIVHKTKSTYYNTATPRLLWNKSQNLVKLYTRQSLHTTTQLLQGSSGTRAKIWSKYMWVDRSQLANRPGSAATRVHTTAGILLLVPSVSFLNFSSQRVS